MLIFIGFLILFNMIWAAGTNMDDVGNSDSSAE
jgi:hypothetical protein